MLRFKESCVYIFFIGSSHKMRLFFFLRYNPKCKQFLSDFKHRFFFLFCFIFFACVLIFQNIQTFSAQKKYINVLETNVSKKKKKKERKIMFYNLFSKLMLVMILKTSSTAPYRRRLRSKGQLQFLVQFSVFGEKVWWGRFSTLTDIYPLWV